MGLVVVVGMMMATLMVVVVGMVGLAEVTLNGRAYRGKSFDVVIKLFTCTPDAPCNAPVGKKNGFPS